MAGIEQRGHATRIPGQMALMIAEAGRQTVTGHLAMSATMIRFAAAVIDRPRCVAATVPQWLGCRGIVGLIGMVLVPPVGQTRALVGARRRVRPVYGVTRPPEDEV